MLKYTITAGINSNKEKQDKGTGHCAVKHRPAVPFGWCIFENALL